MSKYAWHWEDEPQFLLPHARHISVWEVDEDDAQGEELCIIVVRNKWAEHEESVRHAESRAQAICDAMSAHDSDDTPLYHMDDPRSMA